MLQLAGEPNYIYRVTACAFFRQIEGLSQANMSDLFSKLRKLFLT